MRASRLLARPWGTRGIRNLLWLTSALAFPVALQAQSQAPVVTAAAETPGQLDDIVVTARKTSESLQNVPMSVQALGNSKLDQLQVKGFDDYVRYLPSVTYQTSGPGSAKVYFRGVSSGENANHSTSQPTVGVYLDEQPITTISGALDIHLYDIARVEALAGPQGTLYGSSSEAGTIRIITNKPDPTKIAAGVDLEVNKVTDGGFGYVGEGFINMPLTDKVAVRAVGWYDKDAGFIDNVLATRTFAVSGITQTTAPFVKKNYNDVKTYGGRIALGIELDDDWTITPSIMGQKQDANGFFGEESGRAKKRQVAQYNPEFNHDDWYQAALTIEGKIGDWSLTYAGAYMKRKVHNEADYSDYSYFYDALYGSGAYITDNAGNVISPNQRTVSRPRFTKQSHELRISSPSDNRLRFIGGLFFERQVNNIEENYIIANIADDITVPGTDSDIWFTKQTRIDRDYAAFGELSFDILPKLTLTAGARVYHYKNSLEGFFGYAAGYSSKTGVAACFAPADVKGAPCTNVDKTTSDTGWIPKVNLTYHVTDDALVYGTFSRGFRPGGVNRRGTLPPYGADELDNYEFGFKTSWLDNHLRFNGAVYQLKWSNVQLSFLGPNGLSEVRNAGDARIRGFEFDTSLIPIDGLTLTAGGSFNDTKLLKNFCKFANPAFDCTLPGPGGEPNSLLAPVGNRLPDTAKFKANVIARYEFSIRDGLDAHLQGAVVREGMRIGDIRYGGDPGTDIRAIVGDIPAYTTADLSFGVKSGLWTAEIYGTNIFDVNGKTSRSVQCGETTCGDPGHDTAGGGVFYTFLIRPRTVGLKLGRRF